MHCDGSIVFNLCSSLIPALKYLRLQSLEMTTDTMDDTLRREYVFTGLLNK